jgi:hypothetical protein
VLVSWTGYRPWTGDHELDLIELGRRVATAYDEPYAIAYRIGEALGIPRSVVPLYWQHVFGVRSLPNTEHPGSS